MSSADGINRPATGRLLSVPTPLNVSFARDARRGICGTKAAATIVGVPHVHLDAVVFRIGLCEVDTRKGAGGWW